MDVRDSERGTAHHSLPRASPALGVCRQPPCRRARRLTASALPAQLASALQKFNDMIDRARAASGDGSESSGEEEEWQQDEPQEFVEEPDFTVRVQVPASTSQAVSVHAESEGDTDESEEARGRWGPPCQWVAAGPRGRMCCQPHKPLFADLTNLLWSLVGRSAWLASRAG